MPDLNAPISKRDQDERVQARSMASCGGLDAHARKRPGCRRPSSRATVRARPRREQVKQTAFAKLDESVSVAVRLGVDPKHADQIVRARCPMPHGTGEEGRVLVIAQGEKIKEAERRRRLRGRRVRAKDQEGWMDTDVIVATPTDGAAGRARKDPGPRGDPNRRRYSRWT